MPLRETVYLNRDNTVDLLLKADGAAQDLSSVTKMIIKEQAGSFNIDSDTYGSAFDWNTGTTGKLVLDLAAALQTENVAAGTYATYLIVIDPTNSDGIIWDILTLEVKDI